MSVKNKPSTLTDDDLIQLMRNDIRHLQEIVDKPDTGQRLKKKSLKLIEKIQSLIIEFQTGEIDPAKRKYCKYCGELYNSDWTLFHDSCHIFLSIEKYDEKTGELLKKPYESDVHLFSLFPLRDAKRRRNKRNAS